MKGTPAGLVLPANLDAERAVLGAVLLDNAAMPLLDLSAAEFSHVGHQRIWAAMAKLAEDRRPIDPVTLTEQLERCAEIDTIGGVSYLAGLTEGLPRSANVVHYAAIVRDRALRRRIIAMSERSIAQAEELSADPREVLAVMAAGISLVQASAGWEPVGILASHVRPEPVRWLWTGRIPLGKLTILDGDPGVGKSLLTLEIAARLSQAQPLPGDEASASGGAVILSAEDGLGDTIRPRLEAAGADLDRIVIVKYTPDRDGERVICRIPDDIPMIAEAISRVGAKLTVIDVLMAYLDRGTNSYRDQDIRLALAPLAGLATQSQAAVVLIRHLNKTAGANPLYRGGGSIGVIGAARSGMLLARDPEDSDLRLLAMTKSNLGRPAPTLAFRIEERVPAPRILWQGESPHTAAALLATVGTEQDGALAEARAFLLEELAAGPMPAQEIRRRAERAGISGRTLYRSKKAMGVLTSKSGFAGGWSWSLPPASDEGCQS